MPNDSDDRRSTDLGLLTIAKLTSIVLLTLTGFSFINSVLMDKKIGDLELRLTGKFADRSSVVDISTYRAEATGRDLRISRVEATSEANRQIVEQIQRDLTQLRAERMRGK